MNFISENLFAIVFALIVAGIVYGVYFYSTKAVVKRRLKKAKLKSVNQFKSGQTAKIIGSVQCTGQPLVAPLSGRECAYYYVIVEKKVSGGKSSHWKTLIEEEEATGYVLKDGAAHAYIEDGNLKSYVVHDRKYSSGFMEDSTDALEAYLNRHGHESEGFLGFNKTIRYSEAVLEPGETIAVLGTGHWKAAQSIGLPDHYDNVLVISAKEGRSVYLSDDPDTVVNNLVL